MVSKTLFVLYFFVPLAAMAQNSLKVSAGATLHLTGGVRVTLENMHLDNDGDISFAAGNGTFRFSGNTTTNIAGSSTSLFYDVELAKTGTAQLNLQRNINIASGITFISGLLHLNNNNVLLQPAALLHGESDASRIVGSNGGFVEITKSLNAPAGDAPGNLGVVFTSSQNFGSTRIRRGHVSHTANGKSSVNRYFDISPTNNVALDAGLRFHYLDAELNGSKENALVLFKSSNGVDWTAVGFNDRDSITNYIEKDGITSFSQLTLYSNDVPLPVAFASFNAWCDNGKVTLAWKTAQEINSHHFDIERSTNGMTWATIGTLPAAGNSQTVLSYTFTDNNPLAAGAMYRIAEYDIDGRKQYTGIVRSACDVRDELKLSPNPAHDIARLSINTTASTPVVLSVYNEKGSLMLVQKVVLLQGNTVVDIPVRQLANGVYEIKVDFPYGKTKTMRLLKQ